MAKATGVGKSTVSPEITEQTGEHGIMEGLNVRGKQSWLNSGMVTGFFSC